MGHRPRRAGKVGRPPRDALQPQVKGRDRHADIRRREIPHRRATVIRANEDHKHYLKSLPLHHSQRLIEDCGEYADFELYLAPTFDFVMKLLQFGSLIEVISPATLRSSMKSRIAEMYQLYKND